MRKVIQIIDFKTNKIEHEIDVTSKSDRQAERVERGVNINLNHDKYYTVIEEIKESK